MALTKQELQTLITLVEGPWKEPDFWEFITLIHSALTPWLGGANVGDYLYLTQESGPNADSDGFDIRIPLNPDRDKRLTTEAVQKRLRAALNYGRRGDHRKDWLVDVLLTTKDNTLTVFVEPGWAIGK